MIFVSFRRPYIHKNEIKLIFILLCSGPGILNPRGQRQAPGSLRRREGHGDHKQRTRGCPRMDGVTGLRRLPQAQAERHRRLVQVLRNGAQLDGVDG